LTWQTPSCHNAQVCEWCLQLELDASPFFDYGITGAVLVGLSDGDFQARVEAAAHQNLHCPDQQWFCVCFCTRMRRTCSG
jgi:hypothetical protein